MSFHATIDIGTDIDTIHQALRPDCGSSSRAEMKISRLKDKARVMIEADDSVAFRAMLGSLSRSLELYEKARKIR